MNEESERVEMGFRVNLQALDETADGAAGTIEIFNKQPVSTIRFEPSWVPDQRLAGDVSDFLNRWQLGVQNLVSDVASLVDRLVESAALYHTADQNVISSASSIFQGTGADPGLQAWQG
jgi:hypothetical protein